jgi:hypothetical protein
MIEVTTETLKELKRRMDEAKINTSDKLMPYEAFAGVIRNQFRSPKEARERYVPSDTLIKALFDRFRPVKIKDNCEGIMTETDVDIVDFLLAMNLLSRMEKDKKIKSKSRVITV